MSTFTGNHTGPRQFELPPNIPVVDSAGSYCTLNSGPPRRTRTGGRGASATASECRAGRGSAPRRASVRGSAAACSRRRATADGARSTPGTRGSAMVPSRSLLRSRNVWIVALRLREAVEHRPLDHGRGAHRQQADERTHLQPLTGAVGHRRKHVVEEALLLVPHLVGVVADRVDRGRDPEESLEELDDVGFVGRVVLGQDQRQLQHVLAEHRHPRRAVGLLEPAAGRKRRTAVEHADVVESEEPALEQVLAAQGPCG